MLHNCVQFIFWLRVKTLLIDLLEEEKKQHILVHVCVAYSERGATVHLYRHLHLKREMQHFFHFIQRELIGLIQESNRISF